MFQIFLVVVALILPACYSKTLYFGEENEEGKHWALIVAGSSGWYNYRHQADACHAFQIMKSHGIPEERIVVMMYDDIANSDENPTPGIVINRPNGTDVYKGVPRDYTGTDVSPDNFLNILQGKSSLLKGIGSGKVINSGPKDHVFVNFVDHGAPGLIAFPHDELHAKDLRDAIMDMYKNNQYKKMVFYIEACESGSMFKHLLPGNINVFATTAANATESSYACYFDKTRHTFLGDVYSVKWMEDSDTEDLKSETLREQYMIVKQETNTSHVREFGDMSIGSMTVAEFQGGINYVSARKAPYEPVQLDAVAQGDAPLFIAEYKVKSAKTDEERRKADQELLEVVQTRVKVDKTFATIVSMLTGKNLRALDVIGHQMELTKHACYKRAVTAVSRTCFELGQVDYALRHLYKLVNLCELGVHPRTLELVIQDVCAK